MGGIFGLCGSRRSYKIKNAAQLQRTAALSYSEKS
jgi:hypothetical protein